MIASLLSVASGLCLGFGMAVPQSALALSASSAVVSVPLTWNGDKQGQFILSLCRDLQGNTWIGTEGQGVWRFAPQAEAGKQWTQFTVKDGLGDDNAYALACDKAGRIWIGTDSHGVSVFNGKAWNTYDQITGPLGAHVKALAISPLDGSVWGATEAGLFRYKEGSWVYFIRADGLPSDQATSLAFNADGTLYVGTQCDGIAVSSPNNGYKTWRVIPGPSALPNSATGRGLPSALINCLLVTTDSTVYAGTTTGLAKSRDGGETWTFVRGLNWQAKLTGLYHPVEPIPSAYTGDLLTEDYVTSLAEDGRGRIFVGHRQTGVEVFDPMSGKRVQSGASGAKTDDYAAALLAVDKSVWVGLYGGGLLPPVASDEAAVATPASSRKAVFPSFPLTAKPPSLAELSALRARVKLSAKEIPAGSGVYLGEDWTTQGDWVGRYGSRYAVLCAAAAPLDQYILSDPSYQVKGFAGPHHNDGDGLRSWCTWVQTEDSRVLWDPISGYRREAEWDDHGEDYLQSFEGPDVWAQVKVPAGLHRLSLYLMNKDGHDGQNRSRDYLIELKFAPGDTKIIPLSGVASVQALPTLAQARVRNFWYGVYERFLVRGPGVYFVKVGRNGSFNTILQTVMLDKVSGPATAYETRRSVWYGKDTYHPPIISSLPKTSATVAAALSLWDVLEQSSNQIGANKLFPYRLLAYRAAASGKGLGTEASIAPILVNWRWQLSLWDPAERQAFLAGMKESRQPLLDANPKLALGNQ